MRDYPEAGLSAHRWSLVALVCTIAAALAIASTYRVFSQTWDEPAHIAAGMEWLSRGTYTYEAQHPPLTRVAAAVGPYLRSIRLPAEEHHLHVAGNVVLGAMYAAGNAVLGARDAYRTNLALARLGILPFFLIAAAVVWIWARRLWGPAAGAAAVALLATCPTVLAHAGLATTDMGVTAGIAAALLALTVWLERPGWRESLWLGAAFALAALTKFTSIPFLGVSVLGILAARRYATGTWRVDAAPNGPRARTALALAVLVTIGLVWIGYRGSVGHVRAGSHMILLPAPELFRGLHHVLRHNAHGTPSFLLGQTSRTGWWYYYPVALAVKTPLPLLALALAGSVVAVRALLTRRAWQPAVPVLGGLAILAVSMAGSIDLGVRHVLPIYPLWAVTGAGALVALWRWRRPVGLAVTALLLASSVTTVVRAHPDFLAYFNPLAGAHPEDVLLDSNLDWGQDLYRLAAVARARGIDSIALAYFGTASFPAVGLPQARAATPSERPRGWFAVSETFRHGVYDDYRWVNAYRPVERVGRSILLYDFSAPAPTAAR